MHSSKSVREFGCFVIKTTVYRDKHLLLKQAVFHELIQYL